MFVNQCVGVYVDTDTCLFHYNNLNLSISNLIYSSRLDEFLCGDYRHNFALFHVPFHHDDSWLDRLNSLYSKADKIFVFCSELHNHTVKQLISIDKSKIVLFICGFIEHQFISAKVYRWMDWFTTTVDFYKIVQPDLLDKKLINDPKSKYFDILLGCERLHRNFVYDYINQNKLNDHVIMTYYRRWNIDLRQTEHIFETEGLEFLPESTYTHSVHHVLYYGRKTNLSQVIPFTIYNNTYYSLVAETNAVNEFNFYTEKIVKPILAKRLFVVIAGKGFLKNLRNLGFKTFHGIIDESYDNEDNDQTRWNLAMEQVRYLVQCDPIKIATSINNIVKFNQQLMLKTDWYGHMISNLSEEIHSLIFDHTEQN